MRIKLKGYMSVEAALVFPIVIMVVMMMMGMSFYVYNRCVIKACAYDSLLEGASEEIEGNKDRSLLMSQKLEESINQQCISISDLRVEADAGLLKVNVKVDADVNLLWITSTTLPIHYEEDLVRLDVVKSMRLLEKGKNLIDK